MFLICENEICSRDSNAALSTEMPVTLLQCLQTGECDLILASDKSQWWNVSSVYTEVRQCKINPFQHCFQSRTKLLFPSVRMRLAGNKETGMEELPKANLEGQQRPCKLAVLGVTNWTSHEFLLSCPGQGFPDTIYESNVTICGGFLMWVWTKITAIFQDHLSHYIHDALVSQLL